MSADLVDCGQVRVYGRDAFQDLNVIRTHIRQTLYGRAEVVGATVEAVQPDGTVITYEFDEHVGYPTTPERNWMEEWLNG